MIIREHYIKQMRSFYDSDLVKIITGIRRCGKSVILEQVQDELKAEGKSCLFLDFDLKPIRNMIPDADSLSLNGKVLNDELFYEDILEIAKESASDVEEDEVGFTSNRLGFGACAYYDDDDEDEVARIESVQVAVRNFW